MLLLELEIVQLHNKEALGNGNLQLKVDRVKLLNRRTNVTVEIETFGALKLFQDRSELHMFKVTIVNFVKNTECPRCHFGWPRGSARLNKDRCAQLDVVIAKDVDP